MLLMRNQRFVEDCQAQKNQQARPDHAPGQNERCYAEIKEQEIQAKSRNSEAEEREPFDRPSHAETEDHRRPNDAPNTD